MQSKLKICKWERLENTGEYNISLCTRTHTHTWTHIEERRLLCATTRLSLASVRVHAFGGVVKDRYHVLLARRNCREQSMLWEKRAWPQLSSLLDLTPVLDCRSFGADSWPLAEALGYCMVLALDRSITHYLSLFVLRLVYPLTPPCSSFLLPSSRLPSSKPWPSSPLTSFAHSSSSLLFVLPSL